MEANENTTIELAGKKVLYFSDGVLEESDDDVNVNDETDKNLELNINEVREP